MKNRLGYGLALAVVVVASVAALSSIPSRTAAQSKAAPAKGEPKCIGCSVDGKTTPRLSDGHPDLNGYWNNPAAANSQHVAVRAPDGTVLFDFAGNNLDDQGVPVSSIKGAQFGVVGARQAAVGPTYKPEYEAKVAAIDKTTYGVATGLDPLYECRPLGVPRGSFGAMQIVQTPDVVAVLYNQDCNPPATRLIYMDGRKHPDDLDASFMGDSIGHWEGDVLVVDVTGFNTETWLGGGFPGPRNGLIHSDQLHVAERWTRNGDDLTYEATVNDPVMFVKPWVISPRHVKHSVTPENRYLETVCSTYDKGHIIQPTADDQFQCNYCASTTKPSSVTSEQGQK
jgi:hypothetical protein